MQSEGKITFYRSLMYYLKFWVWQTISIDLDKINNFFNVPYCSFSLGNFTTMGVRVVIFFYRPQTLANNLTRASYSKIFDYLFYSSQVFKVELGLNMEAALRGPDGDL